MNSDKNYMVVVKVFRQDFAFQKSIKSSPLQNCTISFTSVVYSKSTVEGVTKGLQTSYLNFLVLFLLPVWAEYYAQSTGLKISSPPPFAWPA